MPYTPEEKPPVTAMQQLIDGCDRNPLDVLNEWRAGKIDNDVMFVTLQRALLKLQSEPRMADPESFARMRNRAVNKGVTAATVSPAQRLTNDVIDAIRSARLPKPFAVSDKAYEALMSYAKRMLADGLKNNGWVGINISAGRCDMYRDYDGGSAFVDLIDYLVAGNDEPF